MASLNDIRSIDVDINLYDDIVLSSPTYFIDELSSFPHVDNCLNILHINSRSLYNKLNEIDLMLNNSTLKFSLIGISETWLNDSTAGGVT